MWRVEHHLVNSSRRGTLAICKDDGGGLTTVFVCDGSSEKESEPIDSYVVTRPFSIGNEVILVYPRPRGEGSTIYRLLSTIDVDEAAENVNVLVLSASVNPNSKVSK